MSLTTIDLFQQFLQQYDAGMVSRALREFFMEYVRKNADSGFSHDFDKQTAMMQDLMNLFDHAATRFGEND